MNSYSFFKLNLSNNKRSIRSIMKLKPEKLLQKIKNKANFDEVVNILIQIKHINEALDELYIEESQIDGWTSRMEQKDIKNNIKSKNMRLKDCTHYLMALCGVIDLLKYRPCVLCHCRHVYGPICTKCFDNLYKVFGLRLVEHTLSDEEEMDIQKDNPHCNDCGRLNNSCICYHESVLPCGCYY